MKNLFASLTLLCLLLSCTNKNKVQNQTTSIEDETTSKIKVYILGTFHFAQMDSTYNVLDKKHQKSIKQLSETIAKQQPDKVLLKVNLNMNFKINTIAYIHYMQKMRR